MSTEKRQGINWVQVIAAALAAVSSAVVLSTLGVAGTIIGAALGSVTASLGAALYSRTIDASRQQVAAQASALRRVAQARLQVDDAVMSMRQGSAGSDTGVVRAQAHLDEAEQALADAEQHVADGAQASGPAGAPVADGPDGLDDGSEDDAAVPLVPAEGGKRLPWKRVALVAAAVFVIAMIVITGFELLTGRAVSTYTGGSDRSTGSTVPGLAGGGGKPTPSPSTTPSQQPSPSSSTQPSVTPSATPTATPTSTPTVVPTPTPTLSLPPSETPAPSGSPSSSPTTVP